MGLETTTTIAGLVDTNPLDADMISSGDDHLRLIKAVLKATFPGVGGSGYALPITVFEAQLNRLITHVDTIADLILQPKTGQKVIATNGYFSIRDGGHGYYWLDLADTTSTADGFLVHVASDGGRWKLIHNNIFSVAQAGAIGGASIVTTKIQAVIDAAKVITGPPIVDLCGYEHMIDKPLVINNGDIVITNGAITADSTFTADGTGSLALLRLKTGLRILVANILFDCAFLADGIEAESSGFNNKYENLEIKSFLSYGIKLNSASDGDQRIINCLITQSQSTAALRVGVGIIIDTADIKVFNNIIRYCGKGLTLSGNTCLVNSNHFYNGNSGIDVPITNSVNIEITAGSAHTFNDNYIDKGRIVLLDSFSSQWIGNKYVFAATPTHDSVFVFDAVNSVNHEFPEGFYHANGATPGPVHDGTIPFIQFIASGTGSWDVEASAIEAIGQSFNSAVTALGRETSEAITALGKQVIKAESTAKITYTGYSVTNPPAFSWNDRESIFSGNGLINRTIGTGTSGTGTVKVEGSRTSSTKVASVKMADRRGSSSTTLTDTDLGYFEWALLGSSGTNKNTLRLVSSVPGSATENTEWEFNNAGFRPGTDNTLDIGDATHKVQGLYVVEPIISPATVVTMSENLTIGLRWVDDTHFDFLQRGSDGVTRSVRLTTA